MHTGISFGDVEAAVITGLQVVQAILAGSARIAHEGDGWARHCVDRRVAGT